MVPELEHRAHVPDQAHEVRLAPQDQALEGLQLSGRAVRAWPEPVAQGIRAHIAGGEGQAAVVVAPEDSAVAPENRQGIGLKRAAGELAQQSLFHVPAAGAHGTQGQTQKLALLRRGAGLAVQFRLKAGEHHAVAADTHGQRDNEDGGQDHLPGEPHGFTSSR